AARRGLLRRLAPAGVLGARRRRPPGYHPDPRPHGALPQPAPAGGRGAGGPPPRRLPPPPRPRGLPRGGRGALEPGRPAPRALPPARAPALVGGAPQQADRSRFRRTDPADPGGLPERSLQAPRSGARSEPQA